jgi:ferredoxin-NADP reductase
MLRDHLGDDLDAYTYLIAGPPGMVEAMETTLAEGGVPEEQVRPERFSGY